MKIALCTGGTRGDVQPMLALAVALIQAGHEVLLIGPPENRNWVEGYGCPFAGLSINVQEAAKDLSAAMSPAAVVRFMRVLKKGVETQLNDFPPLIAGCDLVVGISLVLGLKTTAEHQNIPYLFLATSPQVLPSGAHPTIALKNHHLPRWINRLDWWTAGKINALTWLRSVNRERRRLGLPVVKGSVWKHILEPMVLVVSDAELGGVPNDVDVAYRQVGHLPLHQQSELNGEVEAFLAAGRPPVYIGFGSMPEKAEETSRLILEAARRSGRRLIMGSGWARLTDLDPGQDHLVVGDLPHEQLFPRTAAVIHHGVAGTTATAARAGVPQIIVPHYFDQYYWAEKIHQVGLGPKAVNRDKLTSQNLAGAIAKAVSNPSYAHRAQQIATALQQKDPLAETVRFIETTYFPKQGWR